MQITMVSVRNLFGVIGLRRRALKSEPIAFLPAKIITDVFPLWQIKAVFTKSRNHQVFVAEEDGEVVGIIRVYWKMKEKKLVGETGKIFSFFVHPAYRKRGIAERLMIEALMFLHQSGTKHVRLRVAETQKAAISFYMKCGFRITEVDKDSIVYKNKAYDDLVMEYTFTNHPNSIKPFAS